VTSSRAAIQCSAAIVTRRGPWTAITAERKADNSFSASINIAALGGQGTVIGATYSSTFIILGFLQLSELEIGLLNSHSGWRTYFRKEFYRPISNVS
jgi:hypothetical protein